MVRQDVAPEDRDQQPLQLSAVLDCPDCGTTFEVIFMAPDGVFDAEDLVDAPTSEVECPSCGECWTAEYPGWCLHEDAG